MPDSSSGLRLPTSTINALFHIFPTLLRTWEGFVEEIHGAPYAFERMVLGAWRVDFSSHPNTK